MTQRLLTFYSCENVCCGDLPAEAVVCVRPEIVDKPNCPEQDDVPQTDSLGYVEGQLVIKEAKGCGNLQNYAYTFSYDDAQIVENYTLTSGDVDGIACKGCLGNWLEQRMGNEVHLVPNEAGGQNLVTQHGCEYAIVQTGAGLTEPIFGNADDGDFTALAGVETFIPTIARDQFWDDLTVQAGATMRPWGIVLEDVGNPLNSIVAYFHIRVNGTLTLDGTLSADGSHFRCANPPLCSVTGLVLNPGPGGFDDISQSGGLGERFNAPAINGAPPLSRLGFLTGLQGIMGGHLGGDGGNGGGAGGSLGYAQSEPLNGFHWQLGSLFRQASVFPGLIIGGGSAGGQGGGGDSTSGNPLTHGGDPGLAGNGGGVLWIFARNIVIGPNGVFSARGEDGEDGGDGVAAFGNFASGAGGSGGGGGGVIYIVYETLINNRAVPADAFRVDGGLGGAGGLGVQGGTNGLPGTDGAAGEIYLLNWVTGLFTTP